MLLPVMLVEALTRGRQGVAGGHGGRQVISNEQFLANLVSDNPSALASAERFDPIPLDRQLLDGNGRLRLLSADELRAIDPLTLRMWCCVRARYLLPTLELVAWLRAVINGEKAIEVAAGMGDLGYHLGIPMSDSYAQQAPDMVQKYALIGNAPTAPPADVERLDAEAAVRRYKPKIVIAAWLTHKYQPGDANGFEHGANEKYIVDRATYIFIGNQRVHGAKRILQLDHASYFLPWIVSRSSEPKRDVVYIWRKPEGRIL